MRIVIKALLVAIAFACVALNVGPLITSGEVNAGSAFGFGLAALSLICCLWFDKINSLIKSLWARGAGRAVLIAATALAVAFAAVFCVTFARIVARGSPSDKKTEYLIVLGCQVEGDKPGIYLTGRINKAYEYLSANPGSKAILSGGQGPDEDISEGQCMFNELTARGIDPSRLTVEDLSTSTIENLRNSVTDLRDSGAEIDEITVVTNDFHEYRACGIAEKNGLKAYPWPSKTPFVGYTPFAVREVFAVIAQIYLKL